MGTSRWTEIQTAEPGLSSLLSSLSDDLCQLAGLSDQFVMVSLPSPLSTGSPFIRGGLDMFHLGLKEYIAFSFVPDSSFDEDPNKIY